MNHSQTIQYEPVHGRARSCGETVKLIIDILQKNGIVLTEKRILKTGNLLYSLNVEHRPTGFFANGKGCSLIEARASAYGEFLERFYSGIFFEGISGIDREDRMSAGCVKKTDIPPHVVLKSVKSSQDLRRIESQCMSNGLAAGHTVEEAGVAALCENFERFVRRQIIENHFVLPEIDLNMFGFSKRMKDAYKELCVLAQKEGLVLKIYDASLNGKYPVTAAALIDKFRGSALVCFGSHPDISVSFERCFLELVQGRDMKSREGFMMPVCDGTDLEESNLEAHFVDNSGVFDFSFFAREASFEPVLWNQQNDPSKWFGSLLEKTDVADVYYHVYYHETMTVMRVYIQGISEIYSASEMTEEGYSIKPKDMIRKLIEDPRVFLLKEKNHQNVIALWEREGADFYLPFFAYGGFPEKDFHYWYEVPSGFIYVVLLFLLERSDEAFSFLEGFYESLPDGPVKQTAFLLRLKRYDSSEVLRDERLDDFFMSQARMAAFDILSGKWPLALFPAAGKHYGALEGYQAVYNLFNISFK